MGDGPGASREKRRPSTHLHGRLTDRASPTCAGAAATGGCTSCAPTDRRRARCLHCPGGTWRPAGSRSFASTPAGPERSTLPLRSSSGDPLPRARPGEPRDGSRRGEAARTLATPHQRHRRGRVPEQRKPSSADPSRPQLSGIPTTARAASATAVTIPAGPGSANAGCAAMPRCVEGGAMPSQASDSHPCHGRRPLPTSRSGDLVASATQAPSSTAAQSYSAAPKGTTTVPISGRSRPASSATSHGASSRAVAISGGTMPSARSDAGHGTSARRTSWSRARRAASAPGSLLVKQRPRAATSAHEFDAYAARAERRLWRHHFRAEPSRQRSTRGRRPDAQLTRARRRAAPPRSARRNYARHRVSVALRGIERAARDGGSHRVPAAASGSMPSSSTSKRRASRYTSSASACRPDR